MSTGFNADMHTATRGFLCPAVNLRDALTAKRGSIATLGALATHRCARLKHVLRPLDQGDAAGSGGGAGATTCNAVLVKIEPQNALNLGFEADGGGLAQGAVGAQSMGGA